MSNEQKGTIYMIKNYCDDKKYIGSTTQELKDRFANHKRMMKSQQKKKPDNMYALYKHMAMYGVNKFYITCLEKVTFSHKNELRAKEDEYIRKFDTVKNGLNSINAMVQKKEKVKKPRSKIVDFIKPLETEESYCSICDHEFEDFYSFEKHMEKTHSRDFVCKKHNASFYTQKELHQHYNLTLPVKNMTCDEFYEYNNLYSQ